MHARIKSFPFWFESFISTVIEQNGMNIRNLDVYYPFGEGDSEKNSLCESQHSVRSMVRTQSLSYDIFFLVSRATLDLKYSA